MKKYLAMLLAVVMVFALGASAFAADTGDTYSSYTFTDFNLTVQVSTTVEGLTSLAAAARQRLPRSRITRCRRASR